MSVMAGVWWYLRGGPNHPVECSIWCGNAMHGFRVRVEGPVILRLVVSEMGVCTRLGCSARRRRGLHRLRFICSSVFNCGRAPAPFTDQEFTYNSGMEDASHPKL